MNESNTRSAQWKNGELILHRDPDAAARAFSSWMTEVDTAIHFLCGLISDDLSDANYWNMWRLGSTPMYAAKYAIRKSLTY